MTQFSAAFAEMSGDRQAGHRSRKREQAEKLRAAAEEIRSSCPDQSNAAARLESVAATLGV